MSLTCRCVLSAVIAVSFTLPSFAQAAASSAASAAVAPAAAPPAKPAPPKKAPDKGPEKHFIESYPLASGRVTVDGDSCYVRSITFPATNGADIIKLLSPEPEPGFTLGVISPSKLAIYYKTASPPDNEKQKVRDHIKELATLDFQSATAVRVPSGSADKTAAQVQATVPADGSIAIRAVRSDCVLILSKDKVDSLTVDGFRRTISQRYWSQPATPPTQRLFYVDATTVAKKLSGASDSSGDASGKTASPKPGGSSSTGESATATSTASPTVSVSVAPGNSTANSKTTSGTDGADSPDAGAPADSSSTDKPSPSDANAKSMTAAQTKSKMAPAAAPKPLTMQSVNDTLVYSNEDGSDRGIFERNRLMAVLDLPRPEVLMNIWSLQASSNDYKKVNAGAEAARELIAHHNDLLQQAIDLGWNKLSQQMKNQAFFDPLFYRYVTRRFTETELEVEGAAAQFQPSNIWADKERNERPNASALEAEVEKKDNRSRWGWCNPNEYCLGFSHAFDPLRPTFTNLLIGMIAASNPYDASSTTVTAMEGQSSAPSDTSCEPKKMGKEKCSNPGIVNAFRGCMEDKDRQLRTFKAQSGEDCELEDRIRMSEQVLAGQEEKLQLRCFRRQTEESFGPATADQVKEYATTRAGLMRAAVADFLFNYKWATQYPHDFIPYDLTQSAQELNAEFNPLVLAFNRDVAAFTENLQAELQCKYSTEIDKGDALSWFRKGDQTFINDGMLSVRGISGVESIVDTVTQSFFDATNPPSLTDLVKSVSDAEKNIPGVLKTNLTANEAAVLLGALNSVQPAQAKVGRQLKLDITPHSLAGASSAELEVKLTAEEVGNPTRFTPDKSADDTLSRVAKHDVNTRVRVESLKLFEVSAFSAMLQRPRSKFPILPPLVEVPYFGSFIGWPLPGAKVYHRSTAIVSAVIVPTAADLAFGIDFGADRLCDQDGCHRADSPNDFGTLPLRNFHRAMVECFATGGGRPYTGLLFVDGLPKDACEKLALFPPSDQKTSPAPDTVPPRD